MTLVLGDGNVCGTTPIMCLGHVHRGGQRPCPKLAPDDDLALTITPCSRGGTPSVGEAPRRAPGTQRGTHSQVPWGKCVKGRSGDRESNRERQCEREKKRETESKQGKDRKEGVGCGRRERGKNHGFTSIF